MSKAYILTAEYNLYDQMGEYFIAWFHQKPTINDLQRLSLKEDSNSEASEEFRYFMARDTEKGSSEFATYILNGGGRTKKMESTWFHLREVASGRSHQPLRPNNTKD